MGSTSSSLSSLKQNPHLLRFVGREHINSKNNEFWQQLLSFAFNNPPRTTQDAKVLEESVLPLLSSLLENNLASKNIGSLVRVFLNYTTKLKAAAPEDANYNIYVWQTFNSLYILRSSIKYLIETLTEDNVLRHFSAHIETDDKKGEDSGSIIVEQFLNALIEVLVDVPLRYKQYKLDI